MTLPWERRYLPANSPAAIRLPEGELLTDLQHDRFDGWTVLFQHVIHL